MSTSYISVTDMFCGAGGSTTGITQAGAEVVLAMNHWEVAINTHNSNYPNTTHIQADIMNYNPRRVPGTRFLVASPSCTNHSIAKGEERKNQAQLGLWEQRSPDPAEERSRCTMWDPLRFAEVHHYDFVIIENVVDVRHWLMFDAWVQAWKSLDYELEMIYFNSMFAHPTPQSRDRIYIVCRKKGIKKPDLSFRPLAYCQKCRRDQASVQSWKNPASPWGKYGKHGQYLYRCPLCNTAVAPYYYAAANAIDWSLPITRIGERSKPLKEKTMNRIRVGLQKQLKEAYLISLSHSSNERGYIFPTSSTLPTQTTRQDMALVLPSIVEMHGEYRVRPVDQALSTVCAATTNHYLLSPYVVEMHGTSTARSISEPLATVCAGATHHHLVMPPPSPFLIRSASDPDDVRIVPVDQAPMPTQCAGGIQHELVVPSPVASYLMSYYHNGTLSSVSEPTSTVTTKDRHALLTAEGGRLSIEECGFRMLRPHEIKRAMAFPDDYIITGGQKEQVRQLGNACTPPVVRMIAERCMAVL